VVTLKISVFLDVRVCRFASSFWCFKGLYYLQKWALLGYYVASSGNFLPTFQNLSVPSSGRRNPERREIGQSYLQSFIQIQSSSSPRLLKHFFLCHSSMRPLLYIIICISIKAILNGRLKDLIFLFKIPSGTCKNFFEICKQFGHATSKSFASPPLQRWTLRNKVLWFFKNIQTTSLLIHHYISEGRILQQWKIFMNNLTLISEPSCCLCLFHAAEADAQLHIKKHTIWQLTNEQSDSSQFTVSRHIEKKLTFIETF